jgi:RHS repeat-associated protein
VNRNSWPNPKGLAAFAVTTYSDGATGNLTRFTYANAVQTGNIFDALNRRTFAGFGTQPGPTYQSTINYTYDGGNGLQQQAVDSLAGTITQVYDGLDRLTSETTPQGSVSYNYDSAGRRTSMTVAGQTAENYAYDNASRLTGITQGTSTVSITYDNPARRTALTLPNGVTVNYSYDAASQLTGLSYSLGSTSLGNLTYAYDGDGRRVSVGGSFARTGLPQALTSATYNANNQLTQWGTTTPSYDLNGNLTGDGANNYTWDARNQLALITAASGGTTIGTFSYDAFGRRASKTIVGGSTSFLYDGVNAVQELSGSTPTANLLSGGVDVAFQRTDSAGARNFLPDALGSTLALTDSTGAIQTQYTYEPFGNTTVGGRASNNSFQFTGRENDGTGLYFYRARYYSSLYQRFVSQDPIDPSLGLNLYEYSNDSPVVFVDPTGFTPDGGNPCPDGTHPATADEIARILSGAKDIARQGLPYRDIKCNQFVHRAINKAFPNALSQAYNTRQIGQGQGPFAKTDSPAVGDLALINIPGHIVLITGMRGGQVSQFVGSQTSTGPAYLNLPDYYWQGRLDALGNVRYYKICLPN